MNLLPHILVSLMNIFGKKNAIGMSLGHVLAFLGLLIIGYFGFAFLEPIYGRIMVGSLIGLSFLVVGIVLVVLSKRSTPDPLKVIQETFVNLIPHVNSSEILHQTAAKNIKVVAPVLLGLGLYLAHVFKEWRSEPK
jgi:hypothetical protein